MQALLPGLTFAAEKSLETLNDARRALNMSPLAISTNGAELPRRRGRPPGTRNKPAELAALPSPAKRRGGQKPGTMTDERRAQIGAATRERWRLINAAGIKPAGSSPNKNEVEQARKILARQAKKQLQEQ